MSKSENTKKEPSSDWTALQIQLGLLPDEPQSRDVLPTAEPFEKRPADTIAPAPIEPHGPTEKVQPVKPSSMDTPPRPAPPTDDPFTSGGFGAGILPLGTEEMDDSEPVTDEEHTGDSSLTEPSSEHEVEMGEAPEEVPDTEPEVEEDKRHHRRRRGRRNRRGDGAEREEGGSRGEKRDSPSDTGNENAEESVEGADVEDEEQEDHEVEPEPFVDWSVPSWQELIASLYRPDR